MKGVLYFAVQKLSNMVAVIFETVPAAGKKDEYFAIAENSGRN
jgi:hypothetical protein